MDEDDIEQMQDERIAQVRDQMREAAMKDAEAIKEGIPAMHKLKMLPEVRNILQKYSLLSCSDRLKNTYPNGFV